MVFSSIIFLFYFLPLTGIFVLFVRSVGRKRNFQLQNFVLLFMSLLFYAWGEPIYVFLMIGSIFMNFIMGKALGRTENLDKRSIILGSSIFINLTLLVVFKYSSMILDFVNTIYPYSHDFISVPEIRLPIGISFFTFQAMSYVIDVYRKEVPVQRNLLDLGLYISFFPQLIAGPIVRYHDINKQLEDRTIDIDGLHYGIKRFSVGFFKKVLIANVVAVASDEIFILTENEITTPLAWLGIICYTLQIYFDFSGYSDMAIGLGRMFGFRFLENFNYPYIAKNIQDFWRRWHISLSSWFRDYLYIPLGGNRKGEFRTYLNQIIVFFLCGLWHGASWTFVVWGLFHGFFLTIEKLFLGKKLKKMPTFIQHLYTIIVFMIGWVIFRAENFSGALIYLKAMFGFGEKENIIIWKYLGNRHLLTIIIMGIIFSTPIYSFFNKKVGSIDLRKRKININGIIFNKILITVLFSIALGLYITYPRITEKVDNDLGETIIDIDSNSPNYQIFYLYPNEKRYNGKDSIKFDGTTTTLPPIIELARLRFDSADSMENWSIKSISISYRGNSKVFEGNELIESIKGRSKHLGEPVIDEEGNIVMDIKGRDPYFTLLPDFQWSEFMSNSVMEEQERNDYNVIYWIVSWSAILLISIALFLVYIKKNGYERNIGLYPIQILYNSLSSVIIIFLFLWTIGSLAANTYNPFIYFRF